MYHVFNNFQQSLSLSFIQKIILIKINKNYKNGTFLMIFQIHVCIRFFAIFYFEQLLLMKNGFPLLKIFAFMFLKIKKELFQMWNTFEYNFFPILIFNNLQSVFMWEMSFLLCSRKWWQQLRNMTNQTRQRIFAHIQIAKA